MSYFTLKRDVFKVFDKVNLDLMNHNLDDLNNDFKYLIPTPPLLVHGVS